MHTLLVITTALFCVHSGAANIITNYGEGDIRLADGPNPFQGRLEIYHDESWGTVCSDGWNENNAQVVCRQLGFLGGVLLDNVVNKYPVPSNISIHLSNVVCDGLEPALTECQYNGWSVNGCNHEQDVNVYCKVHSYRGCFVSEFPNYALTGKEVGMTDPLKLERCMELCDGYDFMGVEGGDSCFCGNVADDYTRYGEVVASECTLPCEGDSKQFCGGISRIAIYERNCLPTSASSGVLLSPNFPGQYSMDDQCEQQINLSMNAKTHVTFHLFALTGDDALTLSDELGDIVTYTASNPPLMRSVIEIDTLNVEFVSSSTSSGGDGYVITYSGVLKCPSSIKFANGSLLMEDLQFYYEGDTALVMCDDGFVPLQEDLVCTEDGEWFPVPSCVEVIPGDLPDEPDNGSGNFEPILLMCVVLVAILGIAFFMVFMGVICSGKRQSSDKTPLENVDTPSGSDNSDSLVDRDMFDGTQGNDNPQVEIEDDDAVSTTEEEGQYLSNIY
ncbi:uncharacterized protein [Antedon mediterranea]|uniref:uncharacterized protein n=1 Tax=Antedon mediterranea TaxID=105859 RepID=UPI003AF8B8B6